MKKHAFIILCVVLCASIGFASPQEQEYYGNSFARLNYVKGDVYIQRAEDLGYEEGTVNLPIVEGDKLGTREGRAEIHFGRRNYLRIDNFTQLDFAKLPRRGDDSVNLHLFAGNIYLRVNSMNVEKEFELHSPDGSFYILEEGLYRFEVRENRETAIIVVEGAVEAAGEEGFEIVRGGEMLVTANGFFNSGPDYLYAANEDMFSEWNRGRDAFHNRQVRTRYLPVDMVEYEAELDYYGRWVYERPYGYVWVPDVYHNSWRPYYHGRWIWYPVCGWTWCSYEPWGWSVSHYGRWHWRLGLGWYWIPTTRWGPAWVHWYSGYDYIGWCPLSYYNRPVVIVNNHFYDRYNDHYYPVHSRAFTVLRRDQLSARQVSKVALTQPIKSQLGKISLSSAQPNIRPASDKIPVKGSAASATLSRSNIRSVSKNYATDRSVRSSGGKSLVSPTRSSLISTRSGTVNKEGASRIRENESAGGSSRSAMQSRSIGSPGARSAIKTYPSRNRSSLGTEGTSPSRTRRSEASVSSQLSRSASRTSSSATGIKTYPSQRTSVRTSRNTSTSEAGTNSPRSSRSYKTTLKQYTSRTASSSPSRSSRQPNSNSSSTVKRDSSRAQLSMRPSSSRTSVRGVPTFRSSASRSSYSSPSPSSSRIRSSSSGSRPYTSGRVSSSRSSSSSRSFKSTSRTQVTRSSPSRSSASRSPSRTSSTKRVKKK
jgi:hypothetical protein